MLFEGGFPEHAAGALEEARRRFPDEDILDSLPGESDMEEGVEPEGE